MIDIVKALHEQPPRREIIEGVAALSGIGTDDHRRHRLPYSRGKWFVRAFCYFRSCSGLHRAVSQYSLLLARRSFHSR